MFGDHGVSLLEQPLLMLIKINPCVRGTSKFFGAKFKHDPLFEGGECAAKATASAKAPGISSDSIRNSALIVT